MPVLDPRYPRLDARVTVRNDGGAAGSFVVTVLVKLGRSGPTVNRMKVFLPEELRGDAIASVTMAPGEQRTFTFRSKELYAGDTGSELYARAIIYERTGGLHEDDGTDWVYTGYSAPPA